MELAHLRFQNSQALGHVEPLVEVVDFGCQSIVSPVNLGCQSIVNPVDLGGQTFVNLVDLRAQLLVQGLYPNVDALDLPCHLAQPWKENPLKPARNLFRHPSPPEINLPN